MNTPILFKIFGMEKLGMQMIFKSFPVIVFSLRTAYFKVSLLYF